MELRRYQLSASLVALLLALLAVRAWGPGREGRVAESAGGQVVPTPLESQQLTEADALPPLPTSATEREAGLSAEGVLPVGELRLELVDDRVSLRSQSVSQEAILGALAARADFVLEVATPLDRKLSVRLERVALRDAISLLLQDQAFAAEYAHSPELGRHRLTRLRVGGELLALPLSPALREQAVLAMDPAGDDRAQLLELLRADPAPAVRRAAVLKLETSADDEVIDRLYDALDDPDLDVVLAVVEALEQIDDPSVIPRLEEMLDEARIRNDPELSDALRATIEWLGES